MPVYHSINMHHFTSNMNHVSIPTTKYTKKTKISPKKKPTLPAINFAGVARVLVVPGHLVLVQGIRAIRRPERRPHARALKFVLGFVYVCVALCACVCACFPVCAAKVFL